MSDKAEAAYHPAHHCVACDRAYPSRAAANSCALEDMAEDDRARRTITRGND